MSVAGNTSEKDAAIELCKAECLCYFTICDDELKKVARLNNKMAMRRQKRKELARAQEEREEREEFLRMHQCEQLRAETNKKWEDFKRLERTAERMRKKASYTVDKSLMTEDSEEDDNAVKKTKHLLTLIEEDAKRRRLQR